jgi:hypothetical protein
MSLTKKNTTKAMTAANRVNALKSSDPITDAGKLQARLNALKHGVRAKEHGLVIPELHEQDEDLQDLRFQLWHKFEPRGDYEAGLLEETVENRWRPRRVVRAEACLLVARRLQFDLDQTPSSLPTRTVPLHRPERQGRERKLALTTDSPSPGEEFRTRQTEFLATLDVEIGLFEKLQDLHRASGDELPAALRESLTILPDEDLNRVMRYETVLDRQYDRLLKQLERGQAEGRRKRARPDDDDDGE